MKRIDPKERCAYCGGQHNTKICPKNGSDKHLRCSYCGSRDHNYESCRKHA